MEPPPEGQRLSTEKRSSMCEYLRREKSHAVIDGGGSSAPSLMPTTKVKHPMHRSRNRVGRDGVRAAMVVDNFAFEKKMTATSRAGGARRWRAASTLYFDTRVGLIGVKDRCVDNNYLHTTLASTSACKLMILPDARWRARYILPDAR